jgi:hypothetical protein
MNETINKGALEAPKHYTLEYLEFIMRLEKDLKNDGQTGTALDLRTLRLMVYLAYSDKACSEQVRTLLDTLAYQTNEAVWVDPFEAGRTYGTGAI